VPAAGDDEGEAAAATAKEEEAGGAAAGETADREVKSERRRAAAAETQRRALERVVVEAAEQVGQYEAPGWVGEGVRVRRWVGVFNARRRRLEVVAEVGCEADGGARVVWHAAGEREIAGLAAEGGVGHCKNGGGLGG
jgi:hypothetical protein